MMENVILIGFMGAGKTSVGTLYSQKHGLDFIDTDQMIEETEGMTVSRIFEEKGEEAFRRMETGLLERLTRKGKAALISAGGGLPLREENRKLLKGLGTVVYLDVSAETVLSRLKGDTTRPLLMGDHVKEKVENMLKARGPIYEEASHVKIDVNNKGPEEIVSEIDHFIGLEFGR